MKCSGDQFTVKVEYEYSGLEEMESMTLHCPGDAFSWIRVSLYCWTCHKEYPGFLDFETS